MKKPIQKVDRPLTPKERLFVKEYLIDLNASAACLRAGYKTSQPNVYGHSLQTKPNIKAEIDKAIETRAQKLDFTAEEVIRDINLILADAMNRDESGEMVDRPSALKACELKGRHKKMWVDKTEHNVTFNMIGNFQIALVNPSVTVSYDKAS